jgi:hypothetical protein
MQNFRRTLVASGLILLVSINAHPDSDDAEAGIGALMSVEQYRAAGLDKLSPAEREYLYQWLQQYAGKVAPQESAAPAAAQSAAIAATPPSAAAVKTTAEPAPVAPQSTLGAVTGPQTTTPAPTSNASQPVATAPDENFGFPEPRVDPQELANQLHATVLEPFRGWSGKTLFYLDNGQVWRQRTAGRHTFTGEDHRVIISENQFGFFEMRLIAADRSVGVKRVR